MDNSPYFVQTDSIRFYSKHDMRRLGAHLDRKDIHCAISEAWEDLRQGRTCGGKAVLSLPESEFWSQPEFANHRHEFTDERLGRKLSSLYGVGPKYAAVKVIGANVFNRRLGLARSTSTIVLLDKFTMRPLCILDGTEISAARTGTYASTVFNLFLAPRSGLNVFLFGAGPVAEGRRQQSRSRERTKYFPYLS